MWLPVLLNMKLSSWGVSISLWIISLGFAPRVEAKRRSRPSGSKMPPYGAQWNEVAGNITSGRNCVSTYFSGAPLFTQPAQLKRAPF